VRLGLGYTAFAICVAAFYWDYKLGFESTKYYTAAAVVIYAFINGLLSLWIWGIQQNAVYDGANKNGDRIEISTSTQKYVPIYNVSVTTYKYKGKTESVTFSKPFMEWFDKKGHFVSTPFQQIFATNVKIVGEADPKRVVEEKKKIVIEKPVDDGRSMDDKWASLLEESSGVAEAETTATPGKGTKRRAKKA
jgi:signal peptidase complex subunit 2